MNIFKCGYRFSLGDSQNQLLLVLTILGLLTSLASLAQVPEQVNIKPFAGRGGDIRYYSKERVPGDHWSDKIQGSNNFLLESEWLITGRGLESSAQLTLSNYQAEFRQGQRSLSQFANAPGCIFVVGYGTFVGSQGRVSEPCSLTTPQAEISLPSDLDTAFFVEHRGTDAEPQTIIGNFGDRGSGIIKIDSDGQQALIAPGEVATIRSGQITIDRFDVKKFRRQNFLVYGLVEDLTELPEITTPDDLEEVPICETEIEEINGGTVDPNGNPLTGNSLMVTKCQS